MASTTPARALGLADQVGALEAGLRADLVVLDAGPAGQAGDAGRAPGSLKAGGAVPAAQRRQRERVPRDARDQPGQDQAEQQAGHRVGDPVEAR